MRGAGQMALFSYLDSVSNGTQETRVLFVAAMVHAVYTKTCLIRFNLGKTEIWFISDYVIVALC